MRIFNFVVGMACLAAGSFLCFSRMWEPATYSLGLAIYFKLLEIEASK